MQTIVRQCLRGCKVIQFLRIPTLNDITPDASLSLAVSTSDANAKGQRGIRPATQSTTTQRPALASFQEFDKMSSDLLEEFFVSNDILWLRSRHVISLSFKQVVSRLL